MSDEPIGVHASDGSLAYPDDPMPVNVRPLPGPPVCAACGHKHWPAQGHADHQWRDDCPYEGLACGCPQRPGEQCPNWNPADNRRCESCLPAAIAEEHPPAACDGLTGGCGYCITLYLAITGQDMRGAPPYCVACVSAHWPWQPHRRGNAPPAW